MADTPSPLDGVQPPIPPKEAPMQTPMQTSQDVMPKTHHHAARVIFIVSIVAYVLLAFVSISIFPTINTGLSAFKVFPLLFFGIGALLWIGIGLIRVACRMRGKNRADWVNLSKIVHSFADLRLM
jgi:hypothetical protein